MQTIPLFPLHVVLFPGGPLHLRIFEPRYVDMVRRCMRDNEAFGVALITDGEEAGGTARTVELGTTARIVDFDSLEDGLLGISAVGDARFRIRSTSVQSDGLNIATVEWVGFGSSADIPEEFRPLADVLREALPQLGPVYHPRPEDFDDAFWVGARMAEILPISLEEKQRCLEMEDPLERLRYLDAKVQAIAEAAQRSAPSSS